MTVAVVTPWLDHHELWADYGRAIEIGPNPTELLIVDNGSTPPLEFATIRNEHNAGFSAASNQGLEAATADVVVFLNNDIAATRTGWLEKLAAAVEPCVLVGSKIRVDRHAYVDNIQMPYLDGWCLAGTRDDLLELGGFDDTLAEPAYYSDNLLCLEARAAGMALREISVGLLHKGSVTSQPGLNPRVREATLTNQARYQTRAREVLSGVFA